MMHAVQYVCMFDNLCASHEVSVCHDFRLKMYMKVFKMISIYYAGRV